MAGVSFFVLFSYFLLDYVVYSQWKADNCKTPSGSVGICKPFKECKQLKAFMERVSKPYPLYYKQAIRSYTCKSGNPGTYVCCSSAPIVIPPPNPDNHKNRGLLPAKEGCGETPWTNRIVGGNATGIFEFPWMALLQFQTPRGLDFQCGGSIINDRYILTASHCLVNLGNDKLVAVRVGEHDFSTDQDCELDKKTEKTVCAPPFQHLKVEEVISHPNYNPDTFQNDIGLVRVAPPYMNTSAANVFPVCLPFNEFSAGPDLDYVRISGWGATENKSYSSALLKVDVKVLDNEDCHRVYKKQTKISYLQMCAGGKGQKDSCNGDSGGPVCTWGKGGKMVQRGVVSVGTIVCGLEGRPGIYTRVVYFMDWILDTIRP